MSQSNTETVIDVEPEQEEAQEMGLVAREEDKIPAQAPAQSNSQLSPLVQAAMSNQWDPDMLQKMLDIQKDYERNEAEKAFHMAMAKFKENPPKVIKDRVNNQFNSKYASKGNLVNTVNEAMGPYGLNSSWDFPNRDDGMVAVACTLTHAQGFSKSVTLAAPPDKSGSKNPIQEIKSTITYLEIATFEAVTGIAASDDGDDDGNGASSQAKPISKSQQKEIQKKLSDHDLDEGVFYGWLEQKIGVKDIADIPEAAYKAVITTLNRSIKNKEQEQQQ